MPFYNWHTGESTDPEWQPWPVRIFNDNGGEIRDVLWCDTDTGMLERIEREGHTVIEGPIRFRLHLQDREPITATPKPPSELWSAYDALVSLGHSSAADILKAYIEATNRRIELPYFQERNQ